MKYVLVKDDSGHDYVIPSEKRSEWYNFDFNDYDFDLPDWAYEIDGGLEFENPRDFGKLCFPPKIKQFSKETKCRRYCVKVTREIEGVYIFHFDFEGDKPTNDHVENLVMNEDINYNPMYEKFEFWEI